MPRRELPEVNAGSMADIAFTLLIFFLVTTTLATDKGERMPLAKWNPEEVPVEIEVTDRNVLDVQIREDGSLVLEGLDFPYEKLTEETKTFLTNNGVNPNYSDSYEKAVVNIVYHENAPYGKYVEAYSNVKAAFNSIRNDEAQRKHNRNYADMRESDKEDLVDLAKEIQDKYPLKIAEKVMDND